MIDLDTYMVEKGIANHPLQTETYTPDQAILKVPTLLNPNGKGLAVVFPPWHNGVPVVNILEHRLRFKGWSVLRYRFHGDILNPDTDQVLESFQRIQQQVARDVNTLTAAGQYERVHLIGMSLGTVSLTYTAGELTKLSSAQLVVGGSDLAQSTWDGTRTQPIKEALESQGMTKDNLQQIWASLAPASHADAFADKPVEFIISPSDRVIPGTHQAELANSMSSAGAIVTSHQSEYGHYGSVIDFCLRGSLPDLG